MRRRFSMDFGAELVDGCARFRLWAPGARSVDLCLSEAEGERLLPMTPRSEGWFELADRAARAGDLYRFRIDGERRVPDPASRFQPGDVHGWSRLVDPAAFEWSDGEWRGRPWEEAVIYELHVGAFTPAGSFTAVAERLDYLVELGVTAIELMPVAEFPGSRNWGYDGVFPFAPDHRYGEPEALKGLIQSAHAKGLMVFLDVVYNHFGPEGNYLHTYAPQFFTERHHTPWGAGINFDGAESLWVREFFIQNALFWLEEYHLDGLRLDAVHAILDDSRPDILEELAARVHEHFGGSRPIHLVLENDHNAAHYLDRARGYAAQWNDDIHHALHVLLTGETGGYYADYHDALHHLGRCLSEGFAYQGEPSGFRKGARRGEPSAHLPPTAFVSFLQNHDQIGNRAYGERLSVLTGAAALQAATAVLLLAPSPPLLFMGQEWGASEPFPFFCDFGPELAPRVTHGRRREFAGFPEFRTPEAQARIPDPNALETFLSARLDWERAARPEAVRWREFHRRLLAVRHREIVPRLFGTGGHSGLFTRLGPRALRLEWRLGDGSRLHLIANLGADAVAAGVLPTGILLAAVPEGLSAEPDTAELPGWSVACWLDDRPER